MLYRALLPTLLLLPLLAALGCGGGDEDRTGGGTGGTGGTGGSGGTGATGLPLDGIPDPTFGIEETVESVYGSDDYFTYYVDNTHPSATDDGNPYGTPELPRLTIPEDLVAGDVVEIHGGPYVGDELDFRGSGTEAEPIFVRGMPGEEPVVNMTFRIRGGYQIFEYINCDLNNEAKSCFSVSGNPDVPDQVHHVAIRHSELHNYNSDLGATGNSSMIGVSNSHSESGEYVHDIVIYRNHIHDNGDATQAERDIHGVGVAANARDVWILENHMHHNSGDSVQVQYYREPPYNYPTRIYIGRNEMHDDQENAIDLKGCRGVFIYQNRLHSYAGLSQGVALGYGTAIVIHEADGHAEDVLVWNNEIWNCTSTGITVSHTAQEIYLVGNIVYDNLFSGTDEHDPDSPWYPGAGIRVRNEGRTYVYGNLLWGSHHGIISVGGDAHSIDARNNLVGDTATGEGYHLCVESDTVAQNSQLDHNLFFQTGGAMAVRWGGAGTFADVGELTAATGLCANCLEADPLVVDAAALDFHPTAASPTIDAGVDLGQTTEERFGLTLDQDYDGQPRPAGAGWDIGPYEWQ